MIVSLVSFGLRGGGGFSGPGRGPARAGARGRGLAPPGPPLPFHPLPSPSTIVTGLYPEHHGIISNNMLDARIGERFSMNAPTAKDARWWGGEPLWITAQQQGQVAASMFWPGSDVEINGTRPKHWRLYAEEVPNRDRVNEVLKWPRLPEPDRPTFITLYLQRRRRRRPSHRPGIERRCWKPRPISTGKSANSGWCERTETLDAGPLGGGVRPWHVADITGTPDRH